LANVVFSAAVSSAMEMDECVDIGVSGDSTSEIVTADRKAGTE
jgi:hypothetical protein